MAPEPEKEKNAKKRLFGEAFDDDNDDLDDNHIVRIPNDGGLGVGANAEEDNDLMDEEEEEEDENYYNSDREPRSNIGPDFVSQFSATYAAQAALAEALGPSGSQQSSESGSQGGAGISTQERVFLRGDGDFAMTQTQKGKSKICYDGYK